MPGRAVLLTLTALLAACDAPPREPKTPTPAAQPARIAPRSQAAEPVQACGTSALERFRRDWSKGAPGAAEDLSTVTFDKHFNAKLNTCFILVTVRPGVSPEKRMLYDAATGELYGEYLGPASGSTQDLPKLCRVESLYCGSRGEWEILVGPYINM